ncbi:uncharacterized protein VTP21DRAFT_130 [Calcarisporiella thermophila]|uniref:uncharacterized protein n=1 Tax=Calcarisporiella thermophila TaxID=911321 RepID=UPI00374401BB
MLRSLGLSRARPKEEHLVEESVIRNWLADTHKGVNHLFNDEFAAAEQVFSSNPLSPFHAIGVALISWMSAMLGFEEQAQAEALKKLEHAETTARKFKESVQAASKERKGDSGNGSRRSPHGMEFEIIEADNILMSALVSFVRESLTEYLRAAYRIRKSYNMYSAMHKILLQHNVVAHHTSSNSNPNLTGSSNVKFNGYTLPSSSSSSSSSFFSTSTQSATTTPESDGESFYDAATTSSAPVTRSGRDTDDRGTTATMGEGNIIDSNVIDGVSFGVGLFSLLFSILPEKVHRILSTFGFNGDRETGLSQLHSVSRSDGIHSPLASLILLTYYTAIAAFSSYLPRGIRFEDCESILRTVKARYPNGRLWMLMEGKELRLKRNIPGALAVFEGAMQRKNEKEVGKLQQLDALFYYEIGWCQILSGEYAKAAAAFETLSQKNKWSAVFYQFIIALCYLEAGDAARAAEYLNSIPTAKSKRFGGRPIPAEQYVQRKLKYYTAKAQELRPAEPALTEDTLRSVVTISPLLELSYFNNGFSHMSDELLTRHRTALESTQEEGTPDDVAVRHLLLASIYRCQKAYDDASRHLDQLMQMDALVVGDRYVFPNAAYELAVIALERGEREEATALLQKVLDSGAWGEYDFESRNGLRTKMALERLIEG